MINRINQNPSIKELLYTGFDLSLLIINPCSYQMELTLIHHGYKTYRNQKF
jgi:hypothetical protein